MDSSSRTGALARVLYFAAALWIVVIAITFGSAPLAAHEGHDHGSDKAAAEAKSLNRAAAVSEAYQLVAVQHADRLVLTLDRADTNEPVSDATIDVTLGSETRTAVPRPDGTFAMAAPALMRPGRHEIVVSVSEGATNDLLITALDVPEPPKRNDRTTVVADTPGRLSDGSVFLPKITQRLLGLRTAPATQATIEPAMTLVGRIIADPNRSGVVQSTISGRMAMIDGRLPRLGEAVKAGQTIALVTPALATIDQTNVQQTAGDLDQQIALAQNKVDQFRPLVRNNTLSSERLRTVEIELENLVKRRASLTTSQRGAEPLVSPVDGVIAGMRAVPGQVVGPADVLFQIVDPRSLWVEALVFDTAVSDLLPDATATVGGSGDLRLRFIGRSRTLQQQSTVMHFEIVDPPANLNIGSPVTVLARTSERVAGLIVPKSAIVSAATGATTVWVQTEPERFQPRTIKTRALDGNRVLVEAGISAGDRLVVIASELVNQVR
jgi:RND family efflux transporter MFP subunit